MTLLICGLVLWGVGHMWRRFVPSLYAGMGRGAYVVSALVIVAALALMIVGYRGADHIHLWAPPEFMKHVNNLLMLIAVSVVTITFTPRGTAWVMGGAKHPQLTGVKIWALAHLAVNGDVASVVLFGGLLAWAVVSVITSIPRSGYG